MVLFQDYFDVGEYRWAGLLLWISAIISIIWGFLLIVSYINTRKRHHLFWGASFSIIFIGFHQVIGTSDYSILLDGFMSAMLAFIPGLLAAGLLLVVFSEKKVFGNIYALFVLIMAILIAMFKFDPFNWLTAETAFVPTVLVMVLHIPSALIIILLPLVTTIKKQTRWPALLMSIGGLLFGAVGLLLVLVTMTTVFEDLIVTTSIDYRFLVMGSFPVFLLFACLLWALGTLIPAKWNFEIPGVEFEDRA